MHLLEAFGANFHRVQLDLGLSRGLQYYTGMVFEIDHAGLGAESQLWARWALRRPLPGPGGPGADPRAGTAFGVERVKLALEAEGRPSGEPRERPTCSSFQARRSMSPSLPRVATTLRRAGKRVDLDVTAPAQDRASTMPTGRATRRWLWWARPSARDELVRLRDMGDGREQALSLADLAREWPAEGARPPGGAQLPPCSGGGAWPLTDWPPSLTSGLTLPAGRSGEILRFGVPSGKRRGTGAGLPGRLRLQVRRESDRQLTAEIAGLPGVTVIVQRARDILTQVTDGKVDIGITGMDLIGEFGTEGNELIILYEDLAFSTTCAVRPGRAGQLGRRHHPIRPGRRGATMRERGEPLRIVTTYPRLTRRFLYEKGITHFSIVPVEGGGRRTQRRVRRYRRRCRERAGCRSRRTGSSCCGTGTISCAHRPA